MTRLLLDDHLLRDLLADDLGAEITGLLAGHEPATTNLYLHRLCRSVVAARGGALTGSWSDEQRRHLGRRLVALPLDVEIVPMRSLAFRMADLVDDFRLSTLGAEAVAAAELLAAPLCVWSGDDGPRIRQATRALDLPYRTLDR